MGVGARVGAPARQARSSVFWLSFERARASRAASSRRCYLITGFLEPIELLAVNNVDYLSEIFGWCRMLALARARDLKVARPC